MRMARRKAILSIPKRLWQSVVHAMTESTNTQKKVENEGGLCEPIDVDKFDPYNASICAESLHVDILTCLALAELYDDPVNNNFDYPWEWRNEDIL